MKYYKQGSHHTGKSGKALKNKVVRESQGTFFLNADYHEIKQSHDFHFKNIAIIISCSM